jgi:hypothetical protein
MLKGKYFLHIFIPLNIFIWGYISYMLYVRFSNKDDEPIFNESVSQAEFSKEDTVEYKLSLNYDDPFLKERLIKKNQHTNRNGNSLTSYPKTSKPSVKEVKRNEITYLGLVQNKSNGSKTAMVSINGQSHLIKAGSIINGLAFQKIDRDFIVVKDGKEKLTISK